MATDTAKPEFTLARDGNVLLLTLVSEDGMNRLTRRKVNALREEIEGFCGPNTPVLPLVITGDPIFSAGADLNEVSRLRGPDACHFQDGPGVDECRCELPCPGLCGNPGILHGRRPRFGASLSSSNCISTCCVWTSGGGLGADHRVGRYAATASVDREGARAGRCLSPPKRSAPLRRCRSAFWMPSPRILWRKR